MHSVRRFLCFERMFLYGGMHDEKGPAGLLIEALIVFVLCLLFIPLVFGQGVIFVLAFLSLGWVNRCLNRSGRYYDLMPVSKNYAAMAALAAPPVVFIVGYLMIDLVATVFAWLNSIIEYTGGQVISAVPFNGPVVNLFGSQKGLMVLVVFLLLLALPLGTVLMMIKSRIIRACGLAVLTAAVYSLLHGLRYQTNLFEFRFADLHGIDILISILTLADLIVISVCIFAGRKLYAGAEEKTFVRLQKMWAFERVLVSSFARGRSNRGLGIAKLLAIAVVCYAVWIPFYPLIHNSWFLFLFVVAALMTVNQILNDGSNLYQMMPISRRYVVNGIFALSVFLCVVYYLAVTNIFNLIIFLGGRQSLPLNLILTGYPINLQSALFSVLTVMIILFAGTALLMIKNQLLRLGSIAAMTAAFYLFVWILNKRLDNWSYTDVIELIEKQPSSGLLITLTAVACALFIPLSIFAGYRFYCRRFTKEIRNV